MKLLSYVLMSKWWSNDLYILTKGSKTYTLEHLPLGLRLVGRKTFSWETVFLYFLFYIVWLAKECKTIFPWGKITLTMKENYFPIKMKGKLFSLSLLYILLPTFLTFPFIFLSLHHFYYMEPNNGKLILELCFTL